MLSYHLIPLGLAWGSVADAVEWDEAERHGNIAKHGIDFVEAVEIFDHPHLTVSSQRGGEERRISLGLIGTRLVAVIWMDRDGTTRLISVRAARRDERRAYQAKFGA